MATLWTAPIQSRAVGEDSRSQMGWLWGGSQEPGIPEVVKEALTGVGVLGLSAPGEGDESQPPTP